MQLDLWTTFVFFGVPLVLGVLGINTGARFCYRAYLQYSTATETAWDGGESESKSERTWRGNLLRGVPILLGALFLTVHAARWTVRVFGPL
jgi:hypothetical protein